ncbi:MAG: 5-formyltetrahydrofolate cyclo-ligase [Victivallaceae bacterium]|nr:5-formyltetrahydrofolate cyclo-ligase [Victivallaceae bacterium]
MDALEPKESLRREFAARRRELSPGSRLLFDREIVRRIESLPEYRRAKAVASFVAFGAEPDLRALAGKRFFLPRFDRSKNEYSMVEIRDRERDLVTGRFGIPEPDPRLPEATDEECREMFYLVPAVACDRFGTRLGRGGGFYDRLLRTVRNSAAVIYSRQLAEFRLPSEKWDRPVAWVITENETIAVNAGDSPAE